MGHSVGEVQFGLVRSHFFQIGDQTVWSLTNFSDQDWDCQGLSILVWSRSRPSPDLDGHIYSVFCDLIQ